VASLGCWPVGGKEFIKWLSKYTDIKDKPVNGLPDWAKQYQLRHQVYLGGKAGW
jgi:hypothetical protein